MSKIEKGLHTHHASVLSSNLQATSQLGRSIIGSNNTTYSEPYQISFAEVTNVAGGSPAEHAGLQPGDRIRNFGDVNWTNHQKLSKLSETVQRNEGVRVPKKM